MEQTMTTYLCQHLDYCYFCCAFIELYKTQMNREPAVLLSLLVLKPFKIDSVTSQPLHYAFKLCVVSCMWMVVSCPCICGGNLDTCAWYSFWCPFICSSFMPVQLNICRVSLLTVVGTWTLLMAFLLVSAQQLETAVEVNILQLSETLVSLSVVVD